MKNHYFKTIFLLFLILTACKSDDESADVDPPTEEKQIPAGSRGVNIVVDEKYNLSNTMAYSIYDSLDMNAKTKTMVAPKEASALVYFLDKNTKNVQAVAAVDSLGTQLTVNAQTVTAAMHDLIPSFLALSKADQANFEATASTIPEYAALVVMVDKLLANKETVYSSNPDFIAQIMKVSQVIIEKYSHDKDHTGERRKKEKVMSEWLKTGSTPQIDNQAYSPVEAVFTPIHKDSNKPSFSKPIDPRTIGIVDDITKLDISDGYYNLKLTQKTEAVQKEILLKAAQKGMEIFVGLLFGRAGNECTVTMVGSLNAKLVSESLSPPTKWKDGAKLILGLGEEVVKNFAKEESCKKIFIDKTALFKIVAQRSNVWFGVINAAYYAKDAAEIGSLALAWIDPLEFQEDMQVYKGQVIPGCVGFEMVKGSVAKEYGAGEKARPAIKAKIISSYEDIDLGLFEFKATWIVTNGNGEISSAFTPTSHDGITTNTWTLPLLGGSYFIRADVLDNESEDLEGSPVKFSTTVKSINYKIELVSSSSYYEDNWLPDGWTNERWIDYFNENQNYPEITGRKFEYSIAVVVKDKNGNPVKDVTVNFFSNKGLYNPNGVKINPSTTTTDFNGKAYAMWTFDGSQGAWDHNYLTITALNPDGVTPIIGSPIEVRSTIIKPPGK